MGPYEDFLEMQKDKYGVDSDGEIRVVDRWDGEEVEDPWQAKARPMIPRSETLQGSVGIERG